MSWLGNLGSWLQQALLPWGFWGLGLAAVLDSWFLPFPSGVDLWMITLCVQDPPRAPLYVLVASIGSVAGASALYFMVRMGEDAVLGKKVAAERLEPVRRRIERSGVWALVVAALLPPPAPFKLFILAAGLLRVPWSKFAFGLLVGRALRYSLEAFLAVRYGREAWQLMLRAGPWAFGGTVLAVLLLVALLKWRRPASQPS